MVVRQRPSYHYRARKLSPRQGGLDEADRTLATDQRVGDGAARGDWSNAPAVPGSCTVARRLEGRSRAGGHVQPRHRADPPAGVPELSSAWIDCADGAADVRRREAL